MRGSRTREDGRSTGIRRRRVTWWLAHARGRALAQGRVLLDGTRGPDRHDDGEERTEDEGAQSDDFGWRVGRHREEGGPHDVGTQPPGPQVDGQREEERTNNTEHLVDEVEDDEADHRRPEAHVVEAALGPNGHDGAGLDHHSQRRDHLGNGQGDEHRGGEDREDATDVRRVLREAHTLAGGVFGGGGGDASNGEGQANEGFEADPGDLRPQNRGSRDRQGHHEVPALAVEGLPVVDHSGDEEAGGNPAAQDVGDPQRGVAQHGDVQRDDDEGQDDGRDDDLEDACDGASPGADFVGE